MNPEIQSSEWTQGKQRRLVMTQTSVVVHQLLLKTYDF